MQLTDNVSLVKGVGEKTAAKLKHLNINTVRDLIYDLPKGFMEMKDPIEPDDELVGKAVAIRANVLADTIYSVKKGKTITFCKIRTSKRNVCEIVYFNAPYVKKNLQNTDEAVFYGVLSKKDKIYRLTQPKIYSVSEYSTLINVLLPIYGLTKGISNNQLYKYIKSAFSEVDLPGEYLTDKELDEFEMSHFQKAIMDIHFPESYEEHKRARKRLAFHEFLVFLLETRCDESAVRKPFEIPMIAVADTGRLLEALPYRLTDAQMRTWNEIENDMCSGICMNRMVQGDVGSGKTIIAVLALLLNAANGYQGVLMAPTEVLASQHYEGIVELVSKYNLPIKVGLLIGSLSAKAKREMQEKISSGYYNVIIGTHALIQDKVSYKNLTLAITDEQHRFGVKQREALSERNNNVHILVMSATPIPRSLAMTLYAGVDLSIIDELPAKRKTIKNCVVDKKSRPTAYKFIAKEVAAGHQVYVICPLVEATEGLEEQCNVEDYCETLRSVLPSNIIVDYLHGKMKAADKNAIMNDFAMHNIDVLVSTTVIEVGINVPNATVIMVENAERFGLASLHQLRGRVGRGDDQSYCIFVNTSSSDSANKRLEILNQSNDGFYIAEQDLKLRGPGEISGIRQSGDFGFEIADIYDDTDALYDAQKYMDILALADRKRYDDVCTSIGEFGFSAVDIRSI